MRKSVAAAAVAASVVIGGATGAYLFMPGLAGAQTSTTTPGTATGPCANGFKSNEDPAHEAKETPEQEAAEDSGAFCGHHGPGPGGPHPFTAGPNHVADPNHPPRPHPPAGAAPGAAAGTTGPGTGLPGFRHGPRPGGPGTPGGSAPAAGSAS